MAFVSIQTFRGMAPRLDARQLADGQAEAATNCRLASGALEAWPGPGPVQPLGLNHPARTLRHLNGRWLAWSSAVETAQAPVAGETRRLVITGLDAPRVTEAAGQSNPPATLLLGVPAPRRAPVAALGPGPGQDTAPGAQATSRAYVQTFVTARGEEGPPSPPSAVVEAFPGQRVDLYGLEPPPTGRADITLRRVYRTATPTEDSALWLFVAEQDAAHPSLVDALEDADLGEELPSAEWLPPPAGLRHVCAHPGGFLAGAAGNELCFSEPFRPHAWPLDYRLVLEEDVTAMAAYGTTLVVATTGRPYLVDGSHPAALGLTRLSESQPCLAARAMAGCGPGVVYPGPDGLYLVGSGSAGGGRLLTAGLLTRENWQTLRPATMVATVHEGRYHAFFEDPVADPWDWADVGPGPLAGTLAQAPLNRFAVNASRQDELAIPQPPLAGRGLVLDLDSLALNFLDVAAQAVAAGPTKDEGLHLAVFAAGQAGRCVLGSPEAEDLEFTWRSKVFAAPRPVTLAAGLVDADYAAGALEVAVLADGVERLRRSLTSARPFRLPGGFKARTWQVEVRGRALVRDIRLATSVAELAE